MDGETKRYIQQEIQRAMNIILSAQTGRVDSVESETINNLYPGMGQTQPRPVMHPFGFASKALADMINVSARSGHHEGNRLILGHRDSLRPDDIVDGEVCIYASDGNSVLRRIDMQNDKITVGSRAADEPFVLGQTWSDHYTSFLEEIIDLLTEILTQLDNVMNHTHITIGLPSTPPTNSGLMATVKAEIEGIKSSIETLKAQDIDSDDIISDSNFTEK